MNNELINNLRAAYKNNTLESCIESINWEHKMVFDGIATYCKDGITLGICAGEAPVIATPYGTENL